MNTIATITGDDIAREAMQTKAQQELTSLSTKLSHLPQIDCPLIHEFVPHMYIRTISMPKDSLIVSKIHKTEHPYVITKGKVSVWIDGVGVKTFTAPHRGITKAGTRRILYVHEECEWSTFHVTEKKDLAEIEKDVIFNPEQDSFINVEDSTISQLKDANEHP